MENALPARRRPPTWLIAIGSALLGVALGAGVLSAQAQTADEGADASDRHAAIEAFAACADDAGIDLPDVHQHRRDRERLTDEEREAVSQAREACGDLLPHAEERAAIRQCLIDDGLLDAEGSRPDPGSRSAEEREAFRAALRACAVEAGIELPARPRRCRPGRPADA